MADAESNPEAKPAHANRFVCEACGAEQRYDAESKKLKCDFCGATREVPKGMGAVVEHDLEAAFQGATDLPTGLGGSGDKVSHCKECGASVNFGSGKTATQCSFCGSSSILIQEENRKLLRPESLVPFAVDKKNAGGSFSSWLSHLWFRPSDLKKLAQVQDLAGIYVPFWTYDAHVESSWTADAGYYYYVTEEYDVEENGETVTRTREIRHTRWEEAWGQRADDYDDVLVCASKGLPPKLSDSLKTFDTGQLVPYTPGFLAGWMAEEYEVDLRNGFIVAQQKIDEEQKSRCSKDVPGDTQRGLDVNSTYTNLTYKHVLLPIWLCAYRYRDKVYQFLVNGQTGEVKGLAPYSWIKITLFSLFIAALVAVAFVLFSKQH
jgi:predicted RNA-binding Zn-ribbon protein involved in translation (DUF1610 family)